MHTLRSRSTVLTGTLLLALALLAGGVRPALAGGTPDAPQALAANGARVNEPKPRVADTTHMKLDLVIRDMNAPVIQGTSYLTITPIAEPVATFDLDARAFTVTSMAMDGRQVSFEHDGRVLKVTLDPPLAMGASGELVTSYEVKDPPAGLFWTPEGGHASGSWPRRAAQIHTQGQPETNSYWFPCHDFPNEKTTTELFVTAPMGYLVSSNGKLVSRERVVLPIDEETPAGADTTAIAEPRLDAFEQWHWVQDKAHSNYLVSLVVGKFDVLDVNEPGVTAPGGGRLPMPVYAPEGRGGDIMASYGKTPEMIRVYEQATGQPYPWDRYAQLVVWNFGAGGMENTSATSMHDNAILEPRAMVDRDLEGLISHELGHQWFGDLLTCASWEHVWLNEGFATYMTGLWVERRSAPPASAPWFPVGREGYLLYVRGLFDGVIAGDTGAAPADVGLASNVYSEPWEPFRRKANPYGKGASVLHMLRARMGDNAFFTALRSYVAKYRFQNVETDQFRRECEAASGQSLEQFFTQWVRRPGVPRLAISAEWKSDSGTLDLSIDQTQTIDGDNPAFEFTLPVLIRTPAGLRTESVKATGKTTTASIRCPQEPGMVAYDPDLTLLAGADITQPTAWLLAQANEGPTAASRMQAIRALDKDPTLQVTEALRRIAAGRRQLPAVRVEAVRALLKRGAELDLRSLFTTAADTWEMRKEVVDSLVAFATDQSKQAGDTFKDTAVEMLMQRIEHEPSVAVRAACVRGLGKLRVGRAAPVIMDALNTESPDDELRAAGLTALADLKPADGLVLAMTFAAEGTNARTRPVAIEVVRKLADQNKDEAFATLVKLLDDGEIRARMAAAEQLSHLPDPRAQTALLDAASNARAIEWRKLLEQRAKEWQDNQAKPTGEK